MSCPILFRPTATSSYIVKVSRECIWDFFGFFSWSYRLSMLENVSRNEHLQLFGQFFSMSWVTDIQHDVALPLVSHHWTSGRLSTTWLCLAFHTIWGPLPLSKLEFHCAWCLPCWTNDAQAQRETGWLDRCCGFGICTQGPCTLYDTFTCLYLWPQSRDQYDWYSPMCRHSIFLLFMFGHVSCPQHHAHCVLLHCEFSEHAPYHCSCFGCQ